MRELLNGITDYIEKSVAVTQFGKIYIEITVKNGEIVYIKRNVEEGIQCDRRAS